MSKKVSISVLFLLALSTAANTDETKSRQVVGGDLVYTASATGNTEEQAIFKAESQSVRMITIECSVAHRETKIFKFSVNPAGTKYIAEVSAGLPIEACEEARNARPDQKATFTNTNLAESQRVYEQILEGEKTLDQPSRAIARQNTVIPAIQPARFAWTPPGYDRYLTAQIDCREKMRNLIRQNETVQAYALAAQCRN